MKKRFAAWPYHWLWLLILCSICLPTNASFGQSSAAGKNEQRDHKQLIKEWKATVTELNKLRFRYRLAESTEKAEIEREFGQLMEKARALEPQVATDLEEQYRQNPASHRELEVILLARAQAAAARSDQTEAVRLSRLLIEGGSTNAEVFVLGVAAAAASNQPDLAIRWASESRKRRTKADQDPRFVEYELRAKQQTAGQQDASKRLPRVKLETSEGDIVLELCEEEAPNTVANFVSLVEKGFYDGLSFHRIIPKFMAQGGDPQGDGTGGPGYHIACECDRPDFRRHFRGSISMAHGKEKDTGGSQFFITFAPQPHLDRLHTVFGYVVDGFDTLDRLEKLGTPSGKPSKTPLINKATVLNKREHKYEVQKLREK